MDALQAEFYALQAENRKLREAWAEQANLLDVVNKLAQTREESIRLVQQVSQLPQANCDGEMRETGLPSTYNRNFGVRGDGSQGRTGDRLGS